MGNFISCKSTGTSGSSDAHSLGKNIIQALENNRSLSEADDIFFTEKDFADYRNEVTSATGIDDAIKRKYRDNDEFTVIIFNKLKPEIISCRNEWENLRRDQKGKDLNLNSAEIISRQKKKDGITMVLFRITFTHATGSGRIEKVHLSAYILKNRYQVNSIKINP